MPMGFVRDVDGLFFGEAQLIDDDGRKERRKPIQFHPQRLYGP